MSIGVWNVLQECPFQRMKQHALYLKEATSMLALLLKYKDKNDKQYVMQQITQQEKHADFIKMNIRSLLNEQIFMPVSRRDLLDLLLIQDAIINKIEDIAGLFFARNMEILDIWNDTWQEFVNIIENTGDCIVELNKDIAHTIDAGFQSRMRRILLETVKKLDEYEHKHDELLKIMRKSLYQVEESLKTIDVWFYYQLLERMGDITNYARRLGFQAITMVTR